MRGVTKNYSIDTSNRIFTFGLRAVLPVILALGMGCKHNPLAPPSDPLKVDTSTPEPNSNNEPSGFTAVANRGFKDLVEDNWIYGGDANAFKVMEDQAAPQSKPSIGHITIPAGFSSGSSPVHFERNIRTSDYVYVNFWFRLSSNWDHNPVFDALMAFWAGDQPRLFFGWRPDSLGNGMRPAMLVSTQMVEGGSRWLDPNVVKDATISAGGWHNIEIIFESKSGATGRYVLWLDHKKIAEYTDVPYGVLEENRHWGIIQVGPSWGGLTPDPLTVTQTLDIDHIYASDKPL